jgi:hypothetical protein
MLKSTSELIREGYERIIPQGLGTPEMPKSLFLGKQPYCCNDFKLLLARHLTPRLEKYGFSGDSFHYFKEDSDFIYIVYFWGAQNGKGEEAGGAVQVDLLVKYKHIHYSGERARIKMHKLRPENCEFQKRLCPNDKTDKFGQCRWFWIFGPDEESNIKVIDDIWRVLKIRGFEYFNQFNRHQELLDDITPENCTSYRDFQIQRHFGHKEIGIVYFLYRYWKNCNNHEKAEQFRAYAINSFQSEGDRIFFWFNDDILYHAY